jgi:hypothetical protein
MGPLVFRWIIQYTVKRARKKDMPFGLKKKVMKNQFRKARNHSSSAYERIKETDVSKIASMVAMLKRALRNKLEVDYVLMDSWFYVLGGCQLDHKKERVCT